MLIPSSFMAPRLSLIGDLLDPLFLCICSAKDTSLADSQRAGFFLSYFFLLGREERKRDRGAGKRGVRYHLDSVEELFLLTQTSVQSRLLCTRISYSALDQLT